MVASLVTVVLGGPHPRHNKIRRGGPFHHHGPPPPRHYAHQNLHSSAPFSHHGHGHGGGPAIGGISNYAYLAGGEGHGAHGKFYLLDIHTNSYVTDIYWDYVVGKF